MADPEEVKKYISMENVLNKINQKYISLDEKETQMNIKILEQTINQVISKMKEKNILFKNMFERMFYGGSYYDGIKVGKPEEFDLDCILNLPKIINPVVECSDKPGFVRICLTEYEKMAKREEAKKFEKLTDLMDEDKYLSTKKCRAWMEKVCNNALNDFKSVSIKTNEEIEVKITKVVKSGPALTLKVQFEDATLDIDLVPCFQFSKKHWPEPPYRINPIPSRDKFLVVPKKPYGTIDDTKETNEYWRLSFQEQERDLLKGGEKKAVKPSLKLLKKLRDKNNHKISSYFIKTLFLWELEKHDRNDNFWYQPLSYVFMKMLEEYKEMIKNRKIPYYWNADFNLIGHLHEKTMIDIAKHLENILDRINKKLVDDPFEVAKYLISPEQVQELRDEVDLGKKFHKSKLDTSVSTSSAAYLADLQSYKLQTCLPAKPEENLSVLHSNLIEKIDGVSQDLKVLAEQTSKILSHLEKVQIDNNQIKLNYENIALKMDCLTQENRQLHQICGNLTQKIDILHSQVGSLMSENVTIVDKYLEKKLVENQEPDFITNQKEFSLSNNVEK